MNPVELPVPPSANHLWRVVLTRKGNAAVARKDAYVSWIESATIRLRLDMPKVEPADYPVAVRITVLRGKGWDRRRDLDNCVKAILDALRKAERIEDDRGDYVTEVSIRFGPDAATACVLVTVEPANRQVPA